MFWRLNHRRADDPILTLDNAFILPHIGSATVETREAMLQLAVANFMAVISGAAAARVRES